MGKAVFLGSAHVNFQTQVPYQSEYHISEKMSLVSYKLVSRNCPTAKQHTITSP